MISSPGKDKLLEKRYQQKQIKETSASQKSRQKIFNVPRSSLQAKDAGTSRPHTQTEAAHKRTSSIPDLTIKQGAHRASNSRQSKSNLVKQAWRTAHSTYNLSKRSFNAHQKKEIPRLAGGGDPDDSSSQQQTQRQTQEFRDYTNYTQFMIDHAKPALDRGTYTIDEYKQKEEHARKLFDDWRATDYKIHE